MIKAIIPVAGVGTRLRPHTHTLPKVLIHVAGKPMIAHILDELVAAGVSQVVLVVGDRGEMVIDYVRNNYDLKVEYVVQEERKGLGHAILLAKECFQNESALIVLGDTLFKADLHHILNSEKKSNYIGVKEVADPRRFGVVQLAGGKIKNFVEKPKDPPSNLAIVGIYFVHQTKQLFACLDEMVETGKRTAGEYQLTDGLQMMLERGEEMRTFLVDGWYDCGKPETLLETNRRLLAVNSSCPEQLKENNIILEPVYVSENVEIKNSIIGPYVSIAEGTKVQRSAIKNTIINENASVKNILLEESLIGPGAEVNGRQLKLNIGDSSQLDLS